MNNAAINQAFLNATDAKTKAAIINNIAGHYGISHAEALDEVTHAEAECILDYMTGEARTAASLLMKRHGIGVAA